MSKVPFIVDGILYDIGRSGVEARRRMIELIDDVNCACHGEGDHHLGSETFETVSRRASILSDIPPF